MQNDGKIIPDYIDNLESIINTSIEKNKVFINLTNDFWKYILNCFHKVSTNNIKICAKLREIFVKYYNLIESDESLKNSKLRKEASEYYKNDEFAFIFDKIIKNYIKKNKKLKTYEKLSLITTYNPYYKIVEYPKRVNQQIFELIDLDNIDKDFIKDFKGMHFECIFQDKLTDYIKSITSKINKIEHFYVIMKLINIQSLQLKDKDKYVSLYLDCLNKKYDIIKKDVEDLLKALNDKTVEEDIKLKFDKTVKIIVNLTFLNFKYEKNRKFSFFDNINKDLPKNILRAIFIGIINKCFNEKENDEQEDEEYEEETKEDNQYDEIIEYIFDKIVNDVKDDDDINNILQIIDCIKGKLNRENINVNEEKDEKSEKRDNCLNKFLQKLIDKNLFKSDEFFALKNIIDSLFKYIENEKN